MQKRVLLIDNEDVSTTCEAIEESAIDDGDIKHDVKCHNYFNPVAKEFFEGDEFSFELMRKNLIEEYLDDKLDVIGCDYNLLTDNKSLTYDIVEVIREHNKSATVFIYSGGMNRSTLKLFDEEGKKSGERYLRIALTSNISGYITNRGAMVERVLEMLKRPSLLLQIEDALTENSKLTLSHAFTSFKGKQLFELAKDVRLQSELGIEFTTFILERGLSHMIDLNTD